MSNGRVPAGDAAGASPLARRTSLRRGITRIARVGLALQALLAILVVVTAALATQDEVHAAAIRDAEDATADLLSSMADQQTGLLTYLKPAQPDSLLLYAAGRAGT